MYQFTICREKLQAQGSRLCITCIRKSSNISNGKDRESMFANEQLHFSSTSYQPPYWICLSIFSYPLSYITLQRGHHRPGIK